MTKEQRRRTFKWLTVAVVIAWVFKAVIAFVRGAYVEGADSVIVAYLFWMCFEQSKQTDEAIALLERCNATTADALRLVDRVQGYTTKSHESAEPGVVVVDGTDNTDLSCGSAGAERISHDTSRDDTEVP